MVDEDGNELYIDIDLSREQVDSLISELITETITATRETLAKAGLTANDLERIVFVGGPTNYKPLRDRVAYELCLSQAEAFPVQIRAQRVQDISYYNYCKIGGDRYKTDYQCYVGQGCD